MTDPVTPAEGARTAQDELSFDEPDLTVAADASPPDQLGAVFQSAFETVTVLERDGTIRYTTPSASWISGYPESTTIGRGGFDRIHPDDLGHRVHPDDLGDLTAAFAECVARPGPGRRVHFRVRHADGHWITMEAVGNNLLDDPDIHGIVISARDITIQLETEQALRASEGRLRDQAHILEMIATSEPLDEILAEICRSVEAHSPNLRSTIWLVDEETMVIRPGAAPSFSDTFVRALDGMPIREGSSVCGTAVLRAETVVVADALDDPRTAPLRDLARAEEIRGCWSTPIRAASDGRVLGTFATYLREPRGPSVTEEAAVESLLQFAAIAIEHHAFENQLSHQAHHDPLTGLPNRNLFHELLEHSLARSVRANTAVAVLFLDLDRFKVVNDSLGHDAGDALLAVLARRLESVLRPGDVVSRFGGDEFTILCEDIDPHAAGRQSVGVAERILDAIGEPFVLDGDEQFLSASVGISLAIGGSERPEDLLRDADAAMYRAKERGRGCCEIFDEAMRARAQDRHEIENTLHRAVSRDELRVFYQPVVSLYDGECVGVEALVRWQHPDRGLLPPGEFIPLAEETGLVVPMGLWVLKAAAAQAAEWQRSQREPGRFRLSVNLSGRQLQDPDLVDTVHEVLDTVGFDPQALCVEITESVLMEDADVGSLKALKAIGVRVSVDDFGTGYSSLRYLRRFPVDEVKIDQSFVARLGTDPADAAIVAAVVSLGHALGVSVVGEGVETEAQLDELRDLGADAAQGFHFAPPQPASDLTPRLLRNTRWG